MTAQFEDTFRLNDTDYSLAGISEGELFDPADLDLEPFFTCTACWRGYHATFSLLDSRLVLDSLLVNVEAPPCINGVSPSVPTDEFALFRYRYDGLALHLEYSGGLLIARDFLSELYVHMGFHPAWKYEIVVELIFESGILRGQHDRSDAAAEFRRQALHALRSREPQMPSKQELRAFVERSFDRTYLM